MSKEKRDLSVIQEDLNKVCGEIGSLEVQYILSKQQLLEKIGKLDQEAKDLKDVD